MQPVQISRNVKILFATFFMILVVLLACSRAIGPGDAPWVAPGGSSPVSSSSFSATATQSAQLPGPRLPGLRGLTPTPDQPRVLPTLRSEPEQYIVQAGDTLGVIAKRYSLRVPDLVMANDITNPDLLEVGQLLHIPAPEPGPPGTSFKVLPDSELVYSPNSADFDIAAFIQNQGGYLAHYSDEVYERTLSGAEVVQRVAAEYSVNPRLLLAVLEYQSGWVTDPNPPEETLIFPIGVPDTWRKGLYFQLAWAANNLNYGYYIWRVNGTGAWTLPNGEMVPIDPSLNAGTAGVQYFFAQLYDRTEWDQAVGEGGLFTIYNTFFGYPFDRALEPLLPAGLVQPEMQLPFEEDKQWAFTGGPHGGWGGGSAWAAIDFAPPGEALGCVQSDEWVTAVADGMIIRTGDGAVVQDLDESPGQPADGLEQTGWTVLYMHIETRDRIQPGTRVQAGDRIGHPSCEGGVSTGTHVHLARRYNGEWIPADQSLPFVLDGWVSRGAGYEYDGYLQRDNHTVEAWEGRTENNAIQR